MGVRAYAPGSVTTVFVPRPANSDGSLGVSFAIEDGVTVTVSDASRTAVTLDGRSTDFEPVERLLDTWSIAATVEIESEIPVGKGFGASGAATLATALAADREFALGESRETLLQAAHEAELAAGTGQGDVFVQDRGGMVWNTGDGVGRLERTDPLEYAAFDGISTAGVLGDGDATSQIADAGSDALGTFDPETPLVDWFATSWEFATATGLVTERVQEAVSAVESAGGAGTMAMIGETVVAAGVDGVLEERTAITPDGARVESR